MENSKVIAEDRPRFALVSSAAWEDPCSPEIEMVLNTAFFPDRESAVLAMANELCDTLDEKQCVEWLERENSAEIAMRRFSIDGDRYHIDESTAWYSDEGDPDDPGAYRKTWRIVEIPSLV